MNRKDDPAKVSAALQKICIYMAAFEDYERRSAEQEAAYSRLKKAIDRMTDYDREVFMRLAGIKEATGNAASQH